MPTRILLIGGAGFVGSNLGLRFRQAGCEVVVFDNLHRRGSELNLRRFKEAGIDFVHGDIRQPSDLDDLPGSFDVMIDNRFAVSVQGSNVSPETLAAAIKAIDASKLVALAK